MRVCCLIFGTLFLGAVAALSADTVVLKTGFTIEAVSAVRDGDRVRVQLKSGSLDLDAAEVGEIRVPRPPAAAEAPSKEVSPAYTSPARLDPQQQAVEKLLIDAAQRHGLPPAFVVSVARAESGLRHDVVSPKGAVGIMQLMPATARYLGADPYDPVQNVDAGVRLLRMLLLKYDRDGALALAAYNAGSGSVARHQGIPPYAETRQYVRKILKLYEESTGR
jgi:soluble lytic murein transglycosylase-like protein